MSLGLFHVHLTTRQPQLDFITEEFQEVASDFRLHSIQGLRNWQ